LLGEKYIIILANCKQTGIGNIHKPVKKSRNVLAIQICQLSIDRYLTWVQKLVYGYDFEEEFNVT